MQYPPTDLILRSFRRGNSSSYGVFHRGRLIFPTSYFTYILFTFALLHARRVPRYRRTSHVIVPLPVRCSFYSKIVFLETIINLFPYTVIGRPVHVIMFCTSLTYTYIHIHISIPPASSFSRLWIPSENPLINRSQFRKHYDTFDRPFALRDSFTAS